MGGKKTLIVFLIGMLAVVCMPLSAFAYSYGDPNEEAVAEAYKQFVAKLNQSPPDYAGAKSVLQSVREELDMHMGKEPGRAIEQALAASNRDAALTAFQQTLVLNIARRMESIQGNFSDYNQGKLLLAKALATYDALSPLVKAKDEVLDGKIRADFELALQSLGNPGIFGIGVKQPDPVMYASKKDEILKTMQAQFNMSKLEVGHFSPGSGPNNPQNGGGNGMLSSLKNWLPFAVIIVVLAGVILRTMRKRQG